MTFDPTFIQRYTQAVLEHGLTDPSHLLSCGHLSCSDCPMHIPSTEDNDCEILAVAASMHIPYAILELKHLQPIVAITHPEIFL